MYSIKTNDGENTDVYKGHRLVVFVLGLKTEK